MARLCTVCGLPAHVRDPVVSQVVSGDLSGRTAAAMLSVSPSGFHRHMTNCVPRQIAHQAAHAARQATPALEAAHGTAPGTSRRRRGLMLDDNEAAVSCLAHAPRASMPTVSATVAPAAVPDLGADLHALRTRALAILDTAEASGDPKTALAAIREARGTLEALARVEDRVAAHGAAAPLHVAPEWVRTRTAMLAALAGFPEARIAVSDALAALGDAP